VRAPAAALHACSSLCLPPALLTELCLPALRERSPQCGLPAYGPHVTRLCTHPCPHSCPHAPMPPIMQALGRLSELLTPPTPHEVAEFFGDEPTLPAGEATDSAAGGGRRQPAEGSAAGSRQQLKRPQSRQSQQGMAHVQRVGVGCDLSLRVSVQAGADGSQLGGRPSPQP